MLKGVVVLGAVSVVEGGPVGDWGLMAGLVIGPGVAVGVGIGDVPMMPVPGGFPMMVPGVLEAGVGMAVPEAPPEETPEGVDAAPPTACPEVVGVTGPALP